MIDAAGAPPSRVRRAFAIALVACATVACSTSNVRPGPIGDCTGELGCAGPVSGGGANAPDAAGGDGGDGSGDDDERDGGDGGLLPFDAGEDADEA